MAKKNREEEFEDLNLIPIMNLVLILIPLLLLSIVFLEISVVNVTMPQNSLGAPSNTDEEPPKRLRLMVTKEGFWMIEGEIPMPPIDGCSGAVTICLKEGVAAEGSPLDKYNWLQLYNKLLELKNKPGWEDHLQVELVAGADVTFDVLVKAMDVARHQMRPEEEEGAEKGQPLLSEEQFNGAKVVRVEGTDEETGETGLISKPLFPLVVLGLPTTQ